MRKALIGVLIGIAVLAGGWLLGESWIAGRLARAIDANPALQTAAVQPLRDPRRFGVRIDQPQIDDPAGRLDLPWLRLSLRPLSPTTLRLDLADRAQLTLGGRTSDLGLTAPLASLRVSALNRMAPDRLSLSVASVTLDGAALADGLSVQARMVSLGGAAPRPARAAYDADLRLDLLHPQVLAQAGLDLGPLPGPIGAEGGLRLWLDGTPSVTGDRLPRLVGWQTDGVTISAGPLAVRMIGRLSRDDEGRAEGQMALYSRDADAMIGMAAGLGLIPPTAQMLLRAGLSQLSQGGMDPDLPGPEFPEPAEGEMRLPLILRDGQLILAGLPVGPAPMFP